MLPLLHRQQAKNHLCQLREQQKFQRKFCEKNRKMTWPEEPYSNQSSDFGFPEIG